MKTMTSCPSTCDCRNGKLHRYKATKLPSYKATIEGADRRVVDLEQLRVTSYKLQVTKLQSYKVTKLHDTLSIKWLPPMGAPQVELQSYKVTSYKVTKLQAERDHLRGARRCR